MNYPSIDIQGSIIPNDLFSKIRSEQASFQSGKDFNPDLTNTKLKFHSKAVTIQIITNIDKQILVFQKHLEGS